MRPKLPLRQLLRLASLLAVLPLPLAPLQAQRNVPQQSRKEAALRSLRDSGAISNQEYNQRLAQLRGDTSSSMRRDASLTSGNHVVRLYRAQKIADVPDLQTQREVRMKIFDMLIPDGWKMDARNGAGGVDCAYNTGRQVIYAAAPDDSTGVLVLPAPATFFSTSRVATQERMQLTQQYKTFSCSIERPLPLAEGLQIAVSKVAAGGRVLSGFEPVPGLSEELPRIVAAANQRGGHVTAEAGRIRFEGTLNGHLSEGWLVAMQTQRAESAPGGVTTITDLPLFAMIFAPPGQLMTNDRMLMTVLSSINIDPQWIRYNQQGVAGMLQNIAQDRADRARIYQQMQQDNANAAAAQSRIIANSASYDSQVRSQVAHDRSAALDHSAQQFALYMGDQAIYKDPSTGQHVQLSSGYDHVWASSTGNTNSYILTDSAGYNPNGQAGSAGWTQMQMEQ